MCTQKSSFQNSKPSRRFLHQLATLSNWRLSLWTKTCCICYQRRWLPHIFHTHSDVILIMCVCIQHHLRAYMTCTCHTCKCTIHVHLHDVPHPLQGSHRIEQWLTNSPHVCGLAAIVLPYKQTSHMLLGYINGFVDTMFLHTQLLRIQ